MGDTETEFTHTYIKGICVCSLFLDTEKGHTKENSKTHKVRECGGVGEVRRQRDRGSNEKCACVYGWVREIEREREGAGEGERGSAVVVVESVEWKVCGGVSLGRHRDVGSM